MALPPYVVAHPGQVLMCDFGPDPENVTPPGVMTGPLAVKPEIWKERHVVVIKGHYGLATVVPFSTIAPRKVKKFHFRIPAGNYPFFAAHEDNWTKSDLIATVSNHRLDRPFVGGKRAIVNLSPDHFTKVKETVLYALALGDLVQYLR